MNKLLLLLFLFPVSCSAFDLIDLREVTFDYKSFNSGGHDPIIQDSGIINREDDKYIGLNANVDVLHYFYMNNLVHGTSDQPIVGQGVGQFRTVGWQYELGVHLTDWLDLDYEHHSQHLLDYEGSNHFPVENSVGFHLKLFESHKEKAVIW